MFELRERSSWNCCPLCALPVLHTSREFSSSHSFSRELFFSKSLETSR
jgi:hypothetical protein